MGSGKGKVRRHHANDGHRGLLEADIAAYDGRIASKDAPPRRVTEHDHRGCSCFRFVNQRQAAQQGRHAKHEEELGGHEVSAEPLWEVFPL